MADFVSHLEEFRKRLILCLGFFFLATIVSYFFSHELLEILTLPLARFNEAALFFHRPYEAFLTHLKAAAVCALVEGSPQQVRSRLTTEGTILA